MATFSLLDFLMGRSDQKTNDSNFGFVFTNTSGQTNSGENVTVDTLLKETTTATCLAIISQGISQLPLSIQKYNEDGSVEKNDEHPVTKLLNKPNNFQTPTAFKTSIVTTLLIYGNAYLRILRAGSGADAEDGLNTRGRPVQLVPLDPSDITVGANSFGMPTYHHDSYGDIASENIVHIKDLTTFTATGYSRVLLAAEIIGAKLAADRRMALKFKNGGNFSGFVEFDGTIPAESKQAFEESLTRFVNRNDKAGGVGILEGGAKFTSVDAATPADLDLRELRDDLKNEIASMMRVPSFMAAAEGGQQYNNTRSKLASFHRDTLSPIITNIEEELTLKLIDKEDEHVKFDVMEYLKGDIESQSKVARELVTSGVITPNEARAYMGYTRIDEEGADSIIRPNSTSSESTSTTLEDDPENATGGEDGPQSNANEDKPFGNDE
jgi:HK97 family phage portal protein